MHRPSDFRTTAVRVLAVELLCILALWWVGRAFGA
jgi:hypothetical protein